MWESVRGRFEQDLVKTEKNYFSTSARMLLNLGLNYKRTLPFMRTVKGQFAGTNMIGFMELKSNHLGFPVLIIHHQNQRPKIKYEIKPIGDLWEKKEK